MPGQYNVWAMETIRRDKGNGVFFSNPTGFPFKFLIY